MAERLTKTANYDWPLPNPEGIQIEEVAKIAGTISKIDDELKDVENNGNEAVEKVKQDFLAALGDDEHFAQTVAKALGLRVRVDQGQEFDADQQLQARQNIDALGLGDIGVANGVAPLGTDNKVPGSFLPALTTTATVGAAVAGANSADNIADGDSLTGVRSGTGTLQRWTWGNIKKFLQSVFLPLSGGKLSGPLEGVQAKYLAESANNYKQSSFYAPSAGMAYTSLSKNASMPFATYAATQGSSFAPVLCHRYTHNGGWGGYYIFGALNKNAANQGVFQLLHQDDNGGTQRIWSFDGTDGSFSAPGDLKTNGRVWVGSAHMAPDGNVFGTRWNTWGHGNDAFVSINAQIEKRAREYADARKNNCVTDTRFAGWTEYHIDTMARDQWHGLSGYVMHKVYRRGNDTLATALLFGFVQPQRYIQNEGWRQMGYT